MKQYFSVAFAILLILGIAACSPAIPATQEILSTLPPVPAEGYHPLTTRTGMEGIDQILEAAASGDVQSLRSLVEFTNAKCTQRDGLGGPPKCREGEAEGTPMEVLPFLSSEGSFLRKDEIDNWSGIDVSGIYAAYEVNAAVLSSEQYYPVGKYVILFSSEENQPAVALRIGESGIVRVDHIFDSSPESLGAMVQREASTVILAPKS
jgi:hypothetical protein